MEFSQLFKHTSPERRQAVYNEIEENSKPNVDFYIFLALAAIIVIVGLITNSSAVVIGAMLIAPLFWPTISISVSIARGDIRLFKKSLWTLIKASLITIAIVTIFTLVYPLEKIPGSEVLIRTDPNLMHLILAIASGAVAVFALIWPRITYSLAGVLMAAALLPPLGVIGYGIASANLKIASGAFLLYLTNLIAIVSIGVVLFLIFGFRPPRKKESLDFLKKDLAWAAILLFVVISLLSYTMYQATKQTKQEEYIKKVFLENITKLEEYEIDNISISSQKNHATVSVQLKLENSFNKNTAEKMKRKIEDYLGKDTVLKIETMPIITIQ